MWDTIYAPDTFIYGTTPNAFLASTAAQIPAGGRVLCVAEGEGRNAVFLASLGHSVVAVDNSEVGLAKARKLAESNGVSVDFIHADLSGFELEQHGYDAVISIFAHIPKAARVALHGQIADALRPGGVMILEAYRPAQLEFNTGGPPKVELMMSLQGLAEELTGLRFRYGMELEREVIEGQLHTGLAAVVQVIAVDS